LAEAQSIRTALLNRHEAHLWCVATADLAVTVDDDLQSFLSPTERARFERLHVPRVRREFLVTRALVRNALSAYCSVSPRDWEFVTNVYGRPRLGPEFEHLRLNFSISHSHGVVACLIARGHQVGLDIECRERGDALPELFEGVLCTYERDALASTTAHGVEFLHYWTLKEAYSKALGRGLSMPFDEILCTLGLENTAAQTTPADYIRLSDESWLFAHIPLLPHYIAAVAIERATRHHPVALRLLEWVPGLAIDRLGQRLLQPVAAVPWLHVRRLLAPA